MALVEMSVSASLLIVSALLLRRYANKVISRRAILLLWNLTLVRAMIPIHVPLEKIPFLREKVENLNAVMLPATSPAVVTSAMTEQEEAAARIFGIQELLMLVWAIGALVMLTRFLRSYYKQFGLIRDFDYKEVDDPYILRTIARAGIQREIKVYYSNYVKSPVTFKVLKPRILIPVGFYKIPGHRRAVILQHELIHVKRFDVVMRTVMELVLCIHWFNPLMWIMRKYYLIDQEISCDEQVVRSMNKEGRKEYSRTLLELAEREEEITSSFPSFFENKLVVRQRIEAILDYKKMGAGGIAAVILIFSCSLLTFASYTPTEESAAVNGNQEREQVVQQTEEEVQEETETQAETDALRETETDTASTEIETETENNENQNEVEETETVTAEEETEFVRMSDEEYERVIKDIEENYNDQTQPFTEEQKRALIQQGLYQMADIYERRLQKGDNLTPEEMEILIEYGKNNREE